MSIVVLVVLTAYLARSFHTFYGTPPFRAAIKGLAGVLLLAWIVIPYRALLFFVVHLAITRT